MRPKDAKALLNCSYTTLHNYVKCGKLKLVGCDKQQNYDSDSVYKLHDQLCRGKDTGNTLYFFIKNKKYEFKLSGCIIEKIFNVIQAELKKEIGE